MANTDLPWRYPQRPGLGPVAPSPGPRYKARKAVLRSYRSHVYHSFHRRSSERGGSASPAASPSWICACWSPTFQSRCTSEKRTTIPCTQASWRTRLLYRWYQKNAGEIEHDQFLIFHLLETTVDISGYHPLYMIIRIGELWCIKCFLNSNPIMEWMKFLQGDGAWRIFNEFNSYYQRGMEENGRLWKLKSLTSLCTTSPHHCEQLSTQIQNRSFH